MTTKRATPEQSKDMEKIALRLVDHIGAFIKQEQLTLDFCINLVPRAAAIVTGSLSKVAEGDLNEVGTVALYTFSNYLKRAYQGEFPMIINTKEVDQH